MTSQSELNKDDTKVHAVVDRMPTQHQLNTKNYRPQRDTEDVRNSLLWGRVINTLLNTKWPVL